MYLLFYIPPKRWSLYQETYNEKIYKEVHPAGKKSDFNWRLSGPDRGGAAGMRNIGIGTLLGLSDWRVEGFFMAIHGRYLAQKYWKSHIILSFPRLRDAEGGFAPNISVDDRALAQLIAAMRIIHPDAGLVLSTRESAELRDNMLPLGITMMSAGSSTEPGGYSENGTGGDKQFEISDKRTPKEVSETLKSKGYEAVWKDWDRDFLI